MPRNNGRTIEAAPILARPFDVPAVEDRIRKSVEAAARRQLGLAGQMPADLKAAVEQASKTAANRLIELTVVKLADDAARVSGRTGVLERFQEKLEFAADGMKVIDESNHVSDVLAKRATLMGKKRDALVAAGFTPDEALQILIADINARG